jgi:hypothetical protein
MSTYAAPIQLIPTAHSHGGGSITLPFQAVLSNRNYRVDWVNVRTATGVGQAVIMVNAALYGRHWRPQPFALGLGSLFTGSDVLLPEAYVAISYELDWHFFIGIQLISVYSGSLPPGLVFTFVDNFTWTITGIPTTVGYYTVQLKILIDQTYGFITLHIPVLAGNPDPVWGEFEFPDAYISVPYLFDWQLENITYPCTFSLLSGTLPPGLSLNNFGTQAGGYVSGTTVVAPGNYAFTLRATNSRGHADKSFTLDVVPDPNQGSGYIFGN